MKVYLIVNQNLYKRSKCKLLVIKIEKHLNT